ncbi:hypothetical protein [Oceanobacillus sp. Castelsardo]|nr:hypothetical protein [Oceanobacillus sp. Castelsardo]
MKKQRHTVLNLEPVKKDQTKETKFNERQLSELLIKVQHFA